MVALHTCVQGVVLPCLCAYGSRLPAAADAAVAALGSLLLLQPASAAWLTPWLLHAAALFALLVQLPCAGGSAACQPATVPDPCWLWQLLFWLRQMPGVLLFVHLTLLLAPRLRSASLRLLSAWGSILSHPLKGQHYHRAGVLW